MANEKPCSACSWTDERQRSCSYTSHITLFHGASDRGYWSLGSERVLKERSKKPPNFEAANLHYLRTNTTLPLPVIIDEWSEGSRYFQIMQRIHGEPLSEAWKSMPACDRDRVAQQTASYLQQLRPLQSPRLQALHDAPLHSAYLFHGDYRLPHGPFATDDELWAEMAKALRGVPEKARRQLQERMPAAEPYTFTHGDLNSGNIIVKDGNVAAILDWEASGFFPIWWESTFAKVGLEPEDAEWRHVLQAHLPEHAEAWEFWRDFHALAKFPNLDEYGVKLLEQLEHG
jgi:aminoglycoside phosphotransferase (APT) family kinase protein